MQTEPAVNHTPIKAITIVVCYPGVKTPEDFIVQEARCASRRDDWRPRFFLDNRRATFILGREQDLKQHAFIRLIIVADDDQKTDPRRQNVLFKSRGNVGMMKSNGFQILLHERDSGFVGDPTAEGELHNGMMMIKEELETQRADQRAEMRAEKAKAGLSSAQQAVARAVEITKSRATRKAPETPEEEEEEDRIAAEKARKMSRGQQVHGAVGLAIESVDRMPPPREPKAPSSALTSTDPAHGPRPHALSTPRTSVEYLMLMAKTWEAFGRESCYTIARSYRRNRVVETEIANPALRVLDALADVPDANLVCRWLTADKALNWKTITAILTASQTEQLQDDTLLKDVVLRAVLVERRTLGAGAGPIADPATLKATTPASVIEILPSHKAAPSPPAASNTGGKKKITGQRGRAAKT